MIRFCSTLLCCLGLFWVSYAYDWQDGERLTYDIKLGWIKAGQAEFDLQKQKIADHADHAEQYQITVRAWTGKATGTLFSLHDRLRIEGETSATSPYMPLTFVQELHENDYRAFKTVRFDHANNRVVYENKLNNHPPKDLDIQAEARDVISALYAFRSNPDDIKVGAELELPVLQLDKQYKFMLKVIEKIVANSILGDKPVWVLQPIFHKIGEPIPDESKWRIWATADDALIPIKFTVKMNLGSITAELKELNDKSRAPKTLPITGKIRKPHRFELLAQPE